jgi:Uma2 family endonuclease
MAVAVRKRPITVDEFIRMGETGILKADERLELAAGDILSMPPIGPDHNTASLALTRIVTLAVATRAWVSIAGPVRLTPHDLRYPDLTVLKDNERAYRGTLPSAADVLFLIEIADTTLAEDRADKIPLYARAGVRESWIVDVSGAAIEVYRDLQGGAYRSVHRYARTEPVSPEAIPDVTLSFAHILG